MDYLAREDIKENIVAIKINESYRKNLTPLELYDRTRGCWKRVIKSVKDADYALCIANGVVIEAYHIDEWVPAEEMDRETLPYNPEEDKGKIAFFGSIASNEIRERYVGKSVSRLYKKGDRSSVKTFFVTGSRDISVQGKNLTHEEKEIHAASISLDELKAIAIKQSNKKPKETVSTVKQIVREPYISVYAKKRARGRCQLCGERAPFAKPDGSPYLESHHIVWLAKGGGDTIDNVVALCPNCHRKMHVIDDPNDVEKLRASNEKFL